jgi:hypothetical protein
MLRILGREFLEIVEGSRYVLASMQNKDDTFGTFLVGLSGCFSVNLNGKTVGQGRPRFFHRPH